MSNINIFISQWGLKSLASLCISNYIPLWYLFGDYPVQNGKLNICQPISFNSGSKAYVLTMAGVTFDGL